MDINKVSNLHRYLKEKHEYIFIFISLYVFILCKDLSCKTNLRGDLSTCFGGPV